MTNKLNLIGGEPNLTWSTARDGMLVAIIRRDLEGQTYTVGPSLPPQVAQAMVDAHNGDQAALSVWWRRQNEAQLAYYRSLQR